MNTFSAILFHSTNYSIRAAKVLRQADIEHKMIPIPRHLSSDCGYCVRIRSCDTEKAMDLMKNNDIEYDRLEQI